MTSRRGSERRALEANLNVRLSKSTYDLLTEAAVASKLDRAGYVRDLVAKALDRKPDRPPRRSVPADVAALGLLAAHVARANGATVQLVKSIRESGFSPSLHAEAEDTLSELRGVQMRLLAILSET